MSLDWTCPQGHHWPAGDSRGDPQEALCPLCGLPRVQSSDSSERPTLKLRSRRETEVEDHTAAMAPAVTEPETPARTTVWPEVVGYEVLGVVGRGGMGVVYKARQTALNRVVALKMIHTGPGGDPDALSRFRGEAEAIARLQHPGIIQVYEIGLAAAGPYLVMEFARGGSLACRLAGNPQPASTAARLVGAVARAVHAAHEKGILHRDLKPANILLDEPPDTPLHECTPRVSDFGLARRLDDGPGLTITGQVMGTPGYMAPEQARGPSSALAPPADVYSLGVLLYEALTGRPPYRGSTALETVHLMLSEEPVPPSRLRPGLPRDLETICLRCLHRDPDRRYASAAALADDLDRFLGSRPVQARPTTPWERSWKWARRQPGTAALAGSLVVLVAVAFVLVSWQWLRAERAHWHSERDRDRAVRMAEAEAAARREAQRLSARLLLERGVRLCEAGRHGPGLLWLARGLAAVPADDPCLERSLRALIGGWSRAVHRFQWHVRLPDEVRDVAVTADGKFVAAAQGREVRLYQTGSGAEAGPPAILPGMVIRLCPIRDGLMAILWTDDSVQAVRLPGGEKLGPAVVTPTRPRAAAVSPNGRLLLVGGDDHKARLYRLDSGQLQHEWPHQGPVRAVAFCPDGSRAVTAGNDRVAQLWRVGSGELLHSLEGHRGPILAAAFSPDGEKLLTGGEDRSACLWSRHGTLDRTFTHEHGVCAVAFHPEKPIVATGSYDDTACLWEIDTGRRVGAPVHHAGDVDALAFAPGGRHLVTGGEDGTVRCWAVCEPAASTTTLRHPAPVIALALSPDGRLILTSCTGGGVRLWEAASGSCRIVGHSLPAHGLAFAPDGRSFAVGGYDGNLQRYDTATGRPLGEVMTHVAPVLCVAFSPDGRFLATGCEDGDKVVRIWDVQSARVVRRLEGHQRKVSSVAFSLDGTLLLTGSWDRTVRLWDVTTGAAVGAPMRHHDLVQAVAFHADGRTALTGGDDYTARLWDVQTREPAGLPLQHPDKVQAVAFAPQSWLLATGGKGGLARLWEPGIGQPLGPPLPHGWEVRSLCFSPDARTLWTGSWDGTVRAWPMPQPRQGAVEEIRVWLEVHTGQRLDGKGVLVNLDVAAWERLARGMAR